MGTKERQEQILEYINGNGGASVKKLSAEFYISEPTVRRDLDALQRSGALKRTFGGAVPAVETNPQVPLFIREGIESAAKNDICRRASALITDGCTVFIDGSSTAQHLVKHLKKYKDITVVTYSLKTATYLCEEHIKTYCTGGLLLESSLIFTGDAAADFADKVNIDICFMSCKGLSDNGVFSDTSDIETPIRRRFLARSANRVFLMTGDKIGKTYFHTLCRTEDVDYIFSNADVTKFTPSLKKGKAF